MDGINLKLDNKGAGAFVIESGGEQFAEMSITIAQNVLTVLHTEVSQKVKGHGIAARLLQHMVDYARDHDLRVVPLCLYVQVQFKRNRDRYADVWLEQAEKH